MADQLYDGSLGDFAGSMAQDIEEALNELRLQAGLQSFPLTGDTRDGRDRRMFFIAIARGVIRHLRNNEAAFKISINLGEDFPTASTHPHIDVKTPSVTP
jgi:hypothetical protein